MNAPELSRAERAARSMARWIEELEGDRAFPSDLGEWVEAAPVRLPLWRAEMAERQAEQYVEPQYLYELEWRELLLEEFHSNPSIELRALYLLRAILNELLQVKKPEPKLERFRNQLRQSARTLARALAYEHEPRPRPRREPTYEKEKSS